VIGAILKTKKAHTLCKWAAAYTHASCTHTHTHTRTLVVVGSGSRRSRDLGYDIMGYYNGSRWTGRGGTWVQGVEHRVCDIQRVPPPARCTIDRRGDGGGRGVAKNARNVFTPTTAAMLLPLLYYQLPLPLLPCYYHYMYTIPLPLLPRRRYCCLCVVPLCIRRKALVEYSRRHRRCRVRRESFEISAFVSV